jgi:hypothetical protein
LHFLDGDSASTPSLGRRVWTEVELATMLERYRQKPRGRLFGILWYSFGSLLLA